MRRLLLAALAILSVAAAGPAWAQISDDVLKIGVLTDMSGPSSAADGPGSVVAAGRYAVDAPRPIRPLPDWIGRLLAPAEASP